MQPKRPDARRGQCRPQRERDRRRACAHPAHRRRGITILIIEHLMKVVLSLAQRMLVLHHGQLIAEGESEPRSSRTAGDRGLSRREVRAPAYKDCVREPWLSPCCAGRGAQRRLRRGARAVGHRPAQVERGRDRLHRRLERGRQDNVAAHHVRHCSGHLRAHSVCRRGHHCETLPPIRSSRAALPTSRKGRRLFRGLSVQRQPPARRISAARRGRHPARPRVRLRAVPDPARTAIAGRHHAVGRRAANVRHGRGIMSRPKLLMIDEIVARARAAPGRAVERGVARDQSRRS